jgi:hypothetical protein
MLAVYSAIFRATFPLFLRASRFTPRPMRDLTMSRFPFYEKFVVTASFNWLMVIPREIAVILKTWGRFGVGIAVC